MIELRGKYNTAKVFTDNVEATAISQIIDLCNQEFVQDSTIRIMPDTHAGAGCTIGTTMTIKDKIVPNLVGVDIGCGMETIQLMEKDIDLQLLDLVIRQYIPSGFNIRSRSDEHRFAKMIKLSELKCKDAVDINRALCSVGTLGGGNHFIEVNKDDEGNLYLVVHSGSRHLGKQVAEYYQELGYKELIQLNDQKQAIVNEYKRTGREHEIQQALKSLTPHKIHKPLAYVQGTTYQDYLHDMKIVQQYATLNRAAIIEEIAYRMDLLSVNKFTTIHNYIDTTNMILRKGAVSTQKGERVLIPINMRDGSLICIGKGNPDWNYSAPHGAGRLISRGKAKELVSMEEYKKSMEGIFTTSVHQGTLDEAPMAYKPMQEIIDNIQDTVDIVKIIKPVYNFKAGE